MLQEKSSTVFFKARKKIASFPKSIVKSASENSENADEQEAYNLRLFVQDVIVLIEMYRGFPNEANKRRSINIIKVEKTIADLEALCSFPLN